jgi:predicted XRE-type DNA-binding protein
MKISKAYDNVFEALEDDVSAAGNLKLRGRLMTEIRRFIDEQGLTQTQAARKLGITQPRLSDLTRGQINRFSLDALVNMATASGAVVVIEVKRKATTPETVVLTSGYLTVQAQSGVSWTGLTNFDRLVPGAVTVKNTSGQAVI